MRKKRGKRGVDIDITPLIDVLFMLIIFFVLTTAFVQGAVSIDLPSGDPPPVSEKNPIVVTVTKESQILWKGEAVSSPDLAPLVAEALARSDDILVAGDREANYGRVAELLDTLRKLGVHNVGLAFESSSQ